MGSESTAAATKPSILSRLALRPKPLSGPLQVEEDIETVQHFFGKVTATRCSKKCGTSIATAFDPKRHLGNWANTARGTTMSISALACSKTSCGAVTCVGCGKKPVTGTNVVKTEAGTLDWCCDRGRLFAIWVLLARYDQVELKMQENEAVKAADAAKNAGPAKGAADSGKGYAPPRGFQDVMMLLDEARMHGVVSVKAIDFQSADRLTDGVLGQLLMLICALLPSTARSADSPFDQSPPAGLLAALRLGLLVDKVGQLLRNDSIIDIGQRAAVYFPVMDFVKALGGHRATAGLVTHERYYKRGTSGLLILSTARSHGVADDKGRGKRTGDQLVVLRTARDGQAPALVARLDNLAKQSQIMLGLATASNAQHELQSESERVTMKLCEKIVHVHGGVARTSTTRTDPRAGAGGPERPEDDGAWNAFHRAHSFELTEAVTDQHHYTQSFRTLYSPKGRIPHLMKEMASLATSLPAGILVKGSCDTPGVLKCLILGPDATPYTDGLFAFDIACGPEYPDGPPLVRFLGTHHGLVDMNPNLHRDGKVCLSLLGTFDGPPESKWQARRSTILSVLVSIQSMILCDEPWRNEPGCGPAASPAALAACRQYSLDRMALTVRFALLPWLLDPAWKSGIWADAVRAHVRCHAPRIRRTVAAWAHLSPGIRAFREPTDRLEAVRTYAGPRRGRDLLPLLEDGLKNF
ncbi:MAG: hypothetical protein M1826_002603 [Phylliscum demangeonii]|nr:MAG: hypothetical protein M1826_002603 [Phylliscum demangeonii]